MKRSLLLMTLMTAGFLLCLSSTEILAQRGRGGGGGGGGGGSRGGGGFTAPARPAAAPTRPASPAQSRPAGGAASAPPRAGAQATGTGPGGGNVETGKREGSHTTQGGTTIEYKGAGAGGTTGGGTSGGKYVGGVQVTTPGGQTVNKAGKGAAVEGPGGNAAASRTGIANTTGPAGSGAAVSKGGAVSGPGGTAAGRAGAATGPGGTAAYRGGAAVTPHGTYYRSAAAVSGQGAVVRTGASNYYGCFTGSWYAKYPSAWYPAKWAGVAAWTAVAWNAVSGFCGYPAETSTSYDYGSSVVYQDDGVYVNGDQVATSAEYADQATAIADEGKKAAASKDEEWQSLGVFAMVQGEETTSNNIFQLAINKAGVIRGNYYNAMTDTSEPVYGSVDKKTQRAAWTVGDKKTPVYEAGIVNLTEESTTMMVHYSKEKSQQYTLFRIERPEGDAPAGEPKKGP